MKPQQPPAMQSPPPPPPDGKPPIRLPIGSSGLTGDEETDDDTIAQLLQRAGLK